MNGNKTLLVGASNLENGTARVVPRSQSRNARHEFEAAQQNEHRAKSLKKREVQHEDKDQVIVRSKRSSSSSKGSKSATKKEAPMQSTRQRSIFDVTNVEEPLPIIKAGSYFEEPEVM